MIVLMKSLKQALLANATFSTVSGLTMLVFNTQLQEAFGFSADIVFILIGVMLLFFGSSVFFVATKMLSNTSLVKLISFLDILWVVASVILIAFNPFDLESAGLWLTGAVAVLIATFAYLQIKNVRQA